MSKNSLIDRLADAKANVNPNKMRVSADKFNKRVLIKRTKFQAANRASESFVAMARLTD